MATPPVPLPAHSCWITYFLADVALLCNPPCFPSLQQLVSVDDVLKHLIEGMTDVQISIGIWRAVMECERLLKVHGTDMQDQ